MTIEMEKEFDKMKQTIKKLKKENKSKFSLKEAIKVLQKHLREDKSEGSYYHSWVCNIAIQFQDVFSEIKPMGNIKGDSDLIRDVSIKSAKRFLDLLIEQ